MRVSRFVAVRPVGVHRHDDQMKEDYVAERATPYLFRGEKKKKGEHPGGFVLSALASHVWLYRLGGYHRCRSLSLTIHYTKHQEIPVRGCENF